MSDAEATRVAADFGGLSFMGDSGELTGPEGRVVRLAPQPARLLALLLSHRGRVVSRDEIGAHLWPHGSVEVDQGIGFAVREVRKAIEAVGGDPSVLETIPRRGFRILEVGGAGSAGPEEEALAASHIAPGRTPMLAAVAVAALALVLWAVSLFRAGPVPVVVIFQHAAPDDGVSGDLAAQLGQALTSDAFRAFEGVAGIVGPTGTTGFEEPDDPLIRTETGACLVLSGSLRAAGDTGAVVFTQLVRTTDGVHLWASMDTVAVVEQTIPGILDGLARTMEQC